MSATATRLTVVPASRARRRARSTSITDDRWLALQVTLAVVLGVLAAFVVTWAVLATQTLRMSI